MDYEALYNAIFHRRSVRKYDTAPLSGEYISRLNESISEVVPLMPEIKTEFRILGAGQIKSIAPQCLCLYSEKKDGWRINAGFMMQQMELHLSANNIGACWLGLRKPEKETPVPEGMEWVATLCFGTPAQPMHRETADEFKRKSLNEISDVTDLFHVLEAVRLAPSAQNSQPWRISGNAHQVVFSRKKSMLLNKMNELDMGIALCCFWLSLKHQGKETDFSFVPQPVPDKCVFAATATIK